MRTLFIFLFSLSFFWSCNKDSIEEIKVKKKEVTENQNPEHKNKIDENNTSSEKDSSLKTISSKEVKRHIGDSLIIQGYVADVYLSDKVAYLNFENKFPKNVMSATIFSSYFNEFGNLQKYKNKNVEIVGRITTYKKKPQIILTNTEQIKIIN